MGRRFIGHLPRVGLRSGTNVIELPQGRLRAVPFDEWHSFDNSFPYRKSRYDNTAPIFFEIDFGPQRTDSDNLVNAFVEGADGGTHLLQQCYRTLLLATATRLPQPALSVAYLVIDGEDLPPDSRKLVRLAHYARVGPAERELIVHGDHQRHLVRLGESAVPDLADISHLIDVAEDTVAPVLEALERTTRPGFSLLNEAFHLIAGLESLLVGRGEPLTSSFARRYAVLAAEEPDEVEHFHALARSLYKLRSNLVHGRPLPVDETGDRTRFLQERHRYWTCQVTLNAMRWLALYSGSSLDGLRQALDGGWSSPADLAALQEIWETADG